MIVGERKPLDEIREMIEPYRRLLIVGCEACVAVCHSGGRREVGLLAKSLRMAASAAGGDAEIEEASVTRQCEPEFVVALEDATGAADAVLSLACGLGVQTLTEHFREIPALPALNTTFMGVSRGQGRFIEWCVGCGDCVLATTGGICPVSRCSKNLLNGPCGGSQDGRCEISTDIPCVWQEIFDHLNDRGTVSEMRQLIRAKDWSGGVEGKPRSLNVKKVNPE